jgi:hypothetical protein
MQKPTMGPSVGEWEAFPAEPRTGADAQQPTLLRRSGHWARLTASVRRQKAQRKETTLRGTKAGS